MDQITEAAQPQESIRIFADYFYKGSQRFLKAPETISQLDPSAIKRWAIITGLAAASLVITELTPYRGNPVLEAFRPHPPAQAEIYEPPATESSPQSSQEPAQAGESPKAEMEQIPSIEDRIFTNFSAQERATAEAAIAKQIKIYQDQPGHELKTARVLDWEKTTIKPILDSDVAPTDRRFWSEFLSAIAYIETGGETIATSEVGIVGLAQISQTTAEGTAKKHGILSFDLRKGWDSLRLSRFHLQDLMERYGADISLLGYYAGQPFTDNIILEALKRRGTPPNDSILKGIYSNQQLRRYLDHYGVNIGNLRSKDGEEYFKKFMAALRILKEARNQPNYQTIT